MEPVVVKYKTDVSVADENKRLDAFVHTFPFETLAPDLSPSRTTVQKWIAEGFIFVNNEVSTNKSYKLKRGDTVTLEVNYLPETAIPPPEDLDIPVIYNDDHIIVINNPIGIVSHPVPNDLTGTVVNFLYHRKFPMPLTANPLRPGIVHRLDKNTSGLMVIACTDKASATLIDMIKRRDIERKYLAIVYGEMKGDSGEIDLPVGRHPTERKKMSVKSRNPRRALTLWKTKANFGSCSLLEVDLKTGRTHQIRVHCAAIHRPIIGDTLYGGRTGSQYLRQNPKLVPLVKGIERQMLHAWKLTVEHPDTGRRQTFVSPLPADMQGFIEGLE